MEYLSDPAQRVQGLIEHLRLEPHPEGGHFRELYRSERQVRRHGDASVRSALTTIYFLLAAGQHSRWHRVSSDETWHFYEGNPLELIWTDDEASVLHREVLGSVSDGAQPVHVVPAGWWQAARPLGSYTLAGCTVGPGFDFDDFALLADLPEAAALLRQRFPDLRDLI